MCEAIRGMIEEGRLEGIGQGKEQGIKALVEVCQELKMSRQDTIVKVMDKFPLDRAGAEERMERYWRL